MADTLIYDGECPLCRAAVEWISSRTPVHRGFVMMPCQSPDRGLRFPEIKTAECLEAMQLVLADGSRFAGADALPQILSRIRGWRWLAGLLQLPGFSAISPYVYRWIARNRFTISALFRRKSPCTDAECVPPGVSARSDRAPHSSRD